MTSFSEAMRDYRNQLEIGAIQQAYQGLMGYFRELNSLFKEAYPEYGAPGSLYYGYMDMTYFSLFPPALKAKKLKIPIVFVHETFRFEVWLSGANRKVQVETSELLKKSGWDQYHLTANPKSEDSVIDHVLVEDPDFANLAALTGQIESGTVAFINDMEAFFAGRQS